IQEALDRCNGNISRVAGSLGLSRVGLRAKMQRFGLQRHAGNGGAADGH
ncbi:hypothetical protein CH340_26120, partial [Rhodoplanes serenus]